MCYVGWVKRVGLGGLGGLGYMCGWVICAMGCVGKSRWDEVK